jgi:hypothetical protein
MKIRSAVLVTWAAISCACSTSTHAPEAISSPSPVESASARATIAAPVASSSPDAGVLADKKGVVVQMTRTMCFGSCPAYTLTIYDDGRLHYEGQAYVITMGGRDGKLTDAELANVRGAFDRTNFFSQHDTSEEDPGAATDAPRTNIYFNDGTRSKYLRTYWGSPHASVVVADIAKRIDEIVGIEQYIGTEAERKKIPSHP